MATLDLQLLETFINENVMAPFYDKRLQKLESLKLKQDILKRKNPYLYKAKNIGTAADFIKYSLDAFLSSQEETVFGNLMEELAIHICQTVYAGKKAEQGTFKSIDLMFERDNIYFIVGIKSGIYWGNKDQVDAMKRNFKHARHVLKAQGITKEIIAVNGCMYGKDARPFKKNSEDNDLDYYKYCGQEFWGLISGDDQLYKTIILPLDQEAKKRDEAFKEAYNAKINELTLGFSEEFLENNKIDWGKLIDFVSKKA